MQERLHEAESEGEPVISATLAHWLKVSPPAVTMALRRLKRDGFVRVQPDGPLANSAALGPKSGLKATCGTFARTSANVASFVP